MDPSTFHRLLEPQGQALAAAVELKPTEATLLSCHQRLRKLFPDDLAKAAIRPQSCVARRPASSRGPSKCTSRVSARTSPRAKLSNYRGSPIRWLWSSWRFCCGIGGDLIGLSGLADVVAVDLDPMRLARAAENLRAYGRRERVTFVEGDLLAAQLPKIDAAFFDPDRRADGKRHLRLREYAPSLNAVRARFALPLGVKVAPGTPWDDLNSYDAEAELISVDGELKECVLWFGPLKSTGRRATVLPEGATLFADQPGTSPGRAAARLSI